MAERVQRRFLPGRHIIEGYGSGGFRFHDMSHLGSLLALPSGMEAWAVIDTGALTITAFDAVFEESGTIDLFLLGCGTGVATIDPAIRNAFQAAGMGFEALTTPAAARTYNILVAEKRRVAAGLIAVA